MHKHTIERNGLFVETNPVLIEELDLEYINENSIVLEQLQAKDDSIKLNWICKECGYKWISTIRRRTVDGNGCPSCNHRKAINERYKEAIQKNHTSLLEKYPDVASEWHPILNGELQPSEISYGSPMKVWWLCSKCGNEYITSPNQRTGASKIGCRLCGIKRRSDNQKRMIRNIETGEIFECAEDAAREMGNVNSKNNISAVCRGDRKIAFGYHWEYL